MQNLDAGTRMSTDGMVTTALAGNTQTLRLVGRFFEGSETKRMIAEKQRALVFGNPSTEQRVAGKSVASHILQLRLRNSTCNSRRSLAKPSSQSSTPHKSAGESHKQSSEAQIFKVRAFTNNITYTTYS